MPSLRADLVVSKQVSNGEVSYIVKDPLSLKYFRFPALEYSIIALLDGTHTLEAIAEACCRDHPGTMLGLGDIQAFVDQLRRSELLQRSNAERSAALLERLREGRRRKLLSKSSAATRLLYWHCRLCDPDRFFSAVMPHLRWLWSRPFVISALVAFAVAGYLNARGIAELASGVVSLYSFAGFGLFDYLELWALSLVAIVLHEFGHGLTCKRFGGEVHDLGFLLIFFNPAMYCNVSDAYTFTNSRHKFYVTAAGGFVELLIWAGATFLWQLTITGSGLHDFAFKMMLVSGVSTLAFNFNPLMKLDGYYALVDFLDVPNLRDNSLKWLKHWIRSAAFKLDELPRVEPRMQSIYLIYGSLCAVYTALMMAMITLMLANLLIGKLHLAGVPIFCLLIWGLYGSMAKSLWGFLAWLVKARGAAVRLIWGALAALVLTVGIASPFVPIRAALSLPVRLEPARRFYARCPLPGRVTRVMVVSGQTVKQGQLLAQISNADRAQDLTDLEAEARQIESERASASYSQDLLARQRAQTRIVAVNSAITGLRSELAQLAVRAPQDGIVATAHPQLLLGRRLKAGVVVVEIIPSGELVGRAYVPENEVAGVKVGSAAEVMSQVFPGQSFAGKVVEVAPEVGALELGHDGQVSGRYELEIALLGAPVGLRPGMTGFVKVFSGDRATLAGLMWHWASRTFRPISLW